MRELKNLIERLTILHPGAEVPENALPPEIRDMAGPIVSAVPVASGKAPANIGDALASTEREMMLAALREAGGHKGQAAERLGISRHAFKRRLQRLGID